MAKKCRSKKRTSIKKFTTGGLGGSGTTPLSAYQLRNDYNSTPLNNYGQFNPNSTYNQSFELQSGGYGNNMQQYNSGGYGVTLGDSYEQTFNQSQQVGQTDGNYAGISTGANLATGLIESSDANPYNNMYGYQGTSAAGQSAASLGGPVASTGSSVLGMVGSGLDQAMGLQEYNEYGVNTADEGKADLYQAGVAGLDQMGQLTKDVEQGDWWGVLADSAGLSQLTGMQDYEDEQDAAKAKQIEGRKLERQQRRAMREQTAQLNYQPPMMYPNGGTVSGPSKGGVVGYDAYGNPIYAKTNLAPQTAKYTPNELRPRTVTDTRNTAVNTLGIAPEEFRTGYRANPQAYTDSIANVYPNKYKSEQNSLGNWTLSEYISNPNKTIEFANGGEAGANAELETKEVFRTPDGSIEKVPDGTPSHKNGGIKMALPEGTEILGKMKGKYNGKSYKDMGQTLKKQYDKYSKAVTDAKSTISKRTAEMMLDKVQKEFDDLWNDQETQRVYGSSTKYAKGGKIPQFAGDDKDKPNKVTATYEDSLADKYAWYKNLNPEERTNFSNIYSYALNNPDVGFTPNTDYLYGKELGSTFDVSHDPLLMKSTNANRYNQYVSNAGGAANLYNTRDVAYQLYHDPKYKDYVESYNKFLGNQNVPATDATIATVPQDEEPVVNTSNVSTDEGIKNSFNPIVEEATLNAGSGMYSDYNGTYGGNRKKLTGDMSGALGTAAQFAPAAYNLYQGMFGDKRTLDPNDYKNKYANEIRADLQDMKYNIKPELEANELAYQTARRNMRQVAPSTGNLLTNYTALAGSRMRADAGAYARKQNMENQYRGQKAGVLGQLGAQDARTRLGVDQYNESVEAARQGAISTGIDQLAGAAYNIGSSKNQRYNDQLLGKAFQAYASKYNLDVNDPNAFMQFIQTTNG